MTNEGQSRQWNNPQFLEFWKKLEPSVANLMEPLLGGLDLQKGEKVLDVGCGGGLTTLAFARRVVPRGTVTGFDISEPLIKLATQRGGDAGLTNATFVQGDAQVDDIPGGPFDVATSRLGVMFFADPPAAFANIRRHLKPTGRIAFICFQAPSHNPWYPAEIIAKYAPPQPPTPYPPPSPFALGDQSQVTQILREAGFASIQFTPLMRVHEAPVDRQANIGSVANLQLEPDVMAKAVAEIEAHYDRYRVGNKDVHERNYWLVRARN